MGRPKKTTTKTKNPDGTDCKVYRICQTTLSDKVISCGKELPESNFKGNRTVCRSCAYKTQKIAATKKKEKSISDSISSTIDSTLETKNPNITGEIMIDTITKTEYLENFNKMNNEIFEIKNNIIELKNIIYLILEKKSN